MYLKTFSFFYISKFRIFNIKTSMSFSEKLARIFKLDNTNWMRHSNPWSAWTRIPIIILLAIAIWSRVWFGWYSVIPVSLIVVWTFINPRAFKAPKSTKNWTSRSVFGERVWINRKNHPIASHHLTMITILNTVSFFGLPFYGYGLYTLEFWPTCFGITLVLSGKMWFLDRMVWIYNEEKEKNEEYKSWEY